MQKKSKKLFINFKSFLNNRGSIFEIQISSSDYEKYFLIKPKIEITYIFEKHYDIKKEELLKSISLENREVKTICKIDKKYSGFGFRKLVYFSPAEDFYFSVRKEKGSILYRIDEEGGEPKKLWETDKQITGLSIHPNHDKLTISVYDQELEIRKIENLKQEIEKIYAKNK